MALKKRVKPKQATQQRQLSRTNLRPNSQTKRVLASHPNPQFKKPSRPPPALRSEIPPPENP